MRPLRIRVSVLFFGLLMTTRATGFGGAKPVIVFCHGSGDTGRGVEAYVRHLLTPAEMAPYEWAFPSAEPIPYTLAGGARMSVWYDRVGGFDPRFPEHSASVDASAARLMALVDDFAASRGGGETARRRQSGPPVKRDRRRVAIGGFSMGGGIALQTVARLAAENEPPGAVFALSSYLCDDATAYALVERSKKGTTTQWPPTFFAHGASDGFIRPEWGQATAERIRPMRPDIVVKRYVGVEHELVREELLDLLAFLADVFFIPAPSEDSTTHTTTTTTAPVEEGSSSEAECGAKSSAPY